MTNVSTPEAGSGRAVVLIDYQNLYYYLKGRFENGTSPGDHILDFIEALRAHLTEEDRPAVLGRAYADFSGLDEHARHVQRALYLLGVEPIFVPSTMHRNTTDLQLCIDALELAERRADLSTFVLVSGDRDYVPLVQALQRRGRDVVQVAFREHLSPRLFEHVAGSRYLDAEDLLTDAARDVLGEDRSHEQPEEHTEFEAITDLPYPIDEEALRVIEEYFGQYEEVYLTPLLRKLSEVLGDIEDHDPKSLVGDLEDCGAVRLERRRGVPYDYTVLLVNPDHPAVQKVKDEFDEDYDGDYEDDADYDEEPYDYTNGEE
ncbi:MAG: NYN domain-containing protein [Rhodothermales bacterium]|nr:NYN domain-containing protein [Rhodothermales bacterium]